ncbi:MAG: PadR family transcriptional regulator [Phycisphaerales bacterium]|nr:PadR family transcriptional regulator [Phycisphaerales bacterium]
MKIERELMRGAGPVAVLKLLNRRDMYGYELVEAITQRTEGALAMGQSTLYPMLYNLEAQGFIEGYWQEATDADAAKNADRAPAKRDAQTSSKSKPASRDRKYYRLTDKGKKRLADDSKQWEAVIRAMKALGVATLALPRPSETEPCLRPLPQPQ